MMEHRISAIPAAAHEELNPSQKALQDFVYTVSHDLGAPLRAVTGFAKILQQKYADRLDEKGLVYLNFISEGGEKAQNMLASLLQYSRIETQAKPFAIVDLTKILAQTLGTLEDKIRATNAKIQHETLPVIFGDVTQMQMLFCRVLENALLYRREGIAPIVQITAQQTSMGWKISITDNGIGISEKDCQRVFQVFKRLHPDESYPGIGMGLSIAQRIVERHGGIMGVAPALPEGTTCWFTLPKSNARQG